MVVSPEEERHPQEHVSQAVVPPADLDVVPDTVARPCLAGLPQAAATAAAAAAGLGGGQLMHSPPMRLDFGECHAAALRMHAVPARQSGIQYCPTGCDHNINACLPPPCAAAVPGAILPSQQDGGSTSMSPAGAPGDGPTWLVAASRAANASRGRGPAVASLGAMAAAALPVLDQPSAAAPVLAVQQAEEEEQQQQHMEWEDEGGLASPEAAAADETAPIEPAEAAVLPSATAPSATTSRRGRSGSRTAAACDGETTPAEAPRRGRSAGKEAASTPTVPPPEGAALEKGVTEEAVPSTRWRTRNAAAADPADGGQEQPVAPAPASKHGTRRTVAAPSDAARDAGAADSAQQAGPAPAAEPVPASEPALQPAAEHTERRSTRRTAGAATPPAPKPSTAAASSKSKKRKAAEPPMAAEKAGTEQQEVPEQHGAAEREAEATAIAAAEPSADVEQLAAISGLLGCGRCRQSQTGCFNCRPNVVAELVSGASRKGAGCSGFAGLVSLGAAAAGSTPYLQFRPESALLPWSRRRRACSTC